MFQGCVTAKEDDGECHNGYGLALKNLKQFEQATAEFKKAIDLDPELYDALQRRHGLLGLVLRDAQREETGGIHRSYYSTQQEPTATTSR